MWVLYIIAAAKVAIALFALHSYIVLDRPQRVERVKGLDRLSQYSSPTGEIAYYAITFGFYLTTAWMLRTPLAYLVAAALFIADVRGSSSFSTSEYNPATESTFSITKGILYALLESAYAFWFILYTLR